MALNTAQSVGNWHQTKADDIMASFHESIEPSFIGLQDYATWHPILHNLIYNGNPNSPKNPCTVGHWFSELDGHGIYPPADLDGLEWHTVLDTSHYQGTMHTIKIAYSKEYNYLSITLFGCPIMGSVTEYVKIKK